MFDERARGWLRPAARLLAALCIFALLAMPRALLPAAHAQSEKVRHTQDIWLVTSVAFTDEAGNAADATPDMKAAVSAQLDAPVTLSSTLSYQKSESVGGRVVAADGSTPASITVQLGLLTVTNGDGSTASIVAVVATPDISASARGVEASDRIAVDLSAVPSVSNASKATISYAFMQALPPEAQAEETGLSDEQVVGQRIQQGNGRLLGTTNANGMQEAAVTQPQPFPVGQGPQLSLAIYLRAEPAAQSGPAAEGSFGALDALSLDPTQLQAASQTADPETVAVLQQVQQQTQTETGAQAMANVAIEPADPNAPVKPSYAVGGAPNGELACRTDVDSCEMQGFGMAASGSYSWDLDFNLDISHGLVTGQGTWTEHVVSHPPECTPSPPPQGPFAIAGTVTDLGALDLTLEDASGNPNGTIVGAPSEVCNPASGPSAIPGYFPEYIFETLIIAPMDGATAIARGCVQSAIYPQCVSTGGAAVAYLTVTIAVAGSSR